MKRHYVGVPRANGSQGLGLAVANLAFARARLDISYRRASLGGLLVELRGNYTSKRLRYLMKFLLLTTSASLAFAFPSVARRIKEKIGIAFDPAYAVLAHDRASIGMFGLRPGVQVSLVKGRGALASSSAYVVAGMDLWIPTTSRPITPSILLGGHAGLGLVLSYGRFGLSTELRGLVRGGIGNQDSTLAKELSAIRLGFEARFLGVVVSFW